MAKIYKFESVIDLELLKKQTRYVGNVIDGKKLTIGDILELRGLWEMLHDLIDKMEEQDKCRYD